MGPDRISAGHWPLIAGQQRGARGAGAARGAQGAGRLAGPGQPAGIRAAHDAAHVGGDGRVASVHLHLRNDCRQKPAGRARPDPTPRHTPIRPGSGLHLLHRRLFHVPVPRSSRRRRSGGDFRDFYEPSLEHDLQLLSIPADDAARSQGSDGKFSLLVVAALLASRSAVRHARAHLEHDDEHVRRLVLCRSQRGDHGRRQNHYFAGHRRLSGASDDGEGSRRGWLGGVDDDCGDHPL